VQDGPQLREKPYYTSVTRKEKGSKNRSWNGAHRRSSKRNGGKIELTDSRRTPRTAPLLSQSRGHAPATVYGQSVGGSVEKRRMEEGD